MKSFFKKTTWFILLLSAHTVKAQWMEWECRSNNTIAEFSRYVDDMKDRGYAPVNISVVTHFNDPRVSSIWRKANINDWACWHSMNQEALIEKINGFNQNGLSPIDIAVWVENGGEVRFAAIWQKVPYAGIIELGIHENDLAEKIQALDKQGYTPRDINGYVVNGVTLYACIFDKQARGPFTVAAGRMEADFQKEFDRLTPQGYYPAEVNYFNNSGTIRCNGIWVKGSDTWDSRKGYTVDEFQNYLNTKTDEGFVPVDMDQYYVNGEFRFGATLVKYTKPQPVSKPSYVKPDAIPASSVRSVLPIRPVEQQTKVWCWLATGEMIFRYYDLPNLNPSGNFQCGIIGSILNNTVCASNCFNYNCIRGSGSNANTVRMFRDYSWISSRKVFRCNEGYEMRFSAIKDNIDRGKPILCGISPTRRQYYYGAEHVALLIGYEIVNQTPYLIINDPFPYTSYDNPFLKAGGEILQNNQYRISLNRFTNDLFWHWSLSEISIN
jgi:hypothetical protein